MKIKSYEQAVRYLESFIGKVRFEITPEFLKYHDPLERMRVLLDILGNPQNKFRSVLIGGTSGKGSTAYLISHILLTAGYKTGLSISPHLQKINERIQINGQPVSDEQFLGMVSSIVDTIELMKDMSVGAPSYFEIIIAMAFLYSVKENVDIAVAEVGMGGEFDATNTLYPLVAVLTNVSLDHTNVLGGTVQKIAKTKAGIIKGKAERGKRKGENNLHPSSFTLHPIVVTGVKQPSVIKIVEDRCREVGAKLYTLGKDFIYKIKKESLEETVFDLTIDHDRGLQLNHLSFSLLGRHQVENASLAIETVLQLRKFGFKISEEHIREALKTAFFPGRFEVLTVRSISPRPLNDSSNSNLKQSSNLARAGYSKRVPKKDLFKRSFRGEARPHNYTLILDGAHNLTKMKAFLSTLKKLYPINRKVFVIAFKNDKDIKSMLRQILKAADTLIVTEFKAKTDMSLNASSEALNLQSQISRLRQDFGGQANLKYDGDVFLEKNSEKALVKAASLSTMKQFNNSAILVVTGSLYLVGEIRDFIVL